MTPLVAPGLRPGQEIGPVRLIVTCGVGGGGAGGGALLLPKLGQALATGTPTPIALGGGGPAGGAGGATLGGGTRAAPVGSGTGIELKLDTRSSVDPPLSDATLVAS